jgi:hypothetical protein
MNGTINANCNEQRKRLSSKAALCRLVKVGCKIFKLVRSVGGQAAIAGDKE